MGIVATFGRARIRLSCAPAQAGTRLRPQVNCRPLAHCSACLLPLGRVQHDLATGGGGADSILAYGVSAAPGTINPSTVARLGAGGTLAAGQPLRPERNSRPQRQGPVGDRYPGSMDASDPSPTALYRRSKGGANCGPALGDALAASAVIRPSAVSVYAAVDAPQRAALELRPG